jgi:hypothetical protein
LPINPYSDVKITVAQEPTRAFRTDYGWGTPNTSVTVEEYKSGYNLPSLQGKHTEAANLYASKYRTDSDMINQALVKALAKMSDAKTNLPVMFAEKAKTSDLILGKANQIYRAYRYFRRGNFKAVAQTLNITRRSVHKTWLEYKYGWMPLLMDVKNSAEFFAQQHFGGRQAKFTVSETVVDQPAEVTTKSFDPTYSVGSWFGWTSIRGVKTIKIKIECEIDNPHLNAIQQLGLTNPALVAWELVPFSFVFDWFFSVGDYLQGLTAMQGISVKRAFSSRLAVLTTHYVSHAHPGVISRDFQGRPMIYRHGYDFIVKTQGRSYTRNPLSVSPLSVYPPVFGKSLGWDKLVTGLALLRAQGRRL